MRRGALLAAALGWFSLPAEQVGVLPSANVLLTGRFRTALKYPAILQRLDGYYQEQVGRQIGAAFPEIAPGVHFEAWHDMWVFFEPEGEKLSVTMKRQSDGVTNRLARGWMVDLAGRIENEAAVEFQETAPLQQAQSEVYASRKDLTRMVELQPELKGIATWQHAGLVVSASPLTAFLLEPAGAHGVHRLTVLAESATRAKQLLGKATPVLSQPCICAAYSEMAEIDAEVHRDASEKAAQEPQIYLAGFDSKVIEDKIRSEPEMQKRIAAASGQYGIKYRVDKPYGRVRVRWVELAGYSREDGKFQSERALGESSATGARPQTGAPLTLRTKLESLKPGAYRIEIEGETAAGARTRIDRRDFWFDGKIFEEI